jgi:glucokinase
VRDGVVESCAKESLPDGTADEVLATIFTAVDSVFDDAVAGLGVGVPSVVDVREGIVYDVVNIPSWREVPLRQLLEQRYGVPAYIDNDANAFVAGELYFGHARSAGDVVGVTLGTGLGIGVVLDGGLRRGHNCGVGELGTIPYRGGILEDYCSGKYFLRQASGTAEEVAERAYRGDAEAVELFRRFGSELGAALQIVLYAYDPELIVLGGSISQALPLFESSLWEALSTFAFPHSLDALSIRVSDLSDAAVLGATALFFDSTAPARSLAVAEMSAEG